MPHATYTIDPDGMILEVMVGLTGKDMVALMATGQPVPPPIRIPGMIDSGSDVSCVNLQVLRRLGLSRTRRLTSQTVAGPIRVQLFEVSFGILHTGNPTVPLLVIEHLEVMELVQAPQGLDVLIGRDVLKELLMIHDGPKGEFTLTD